MGKASSSKKVARAARAGGNRRAGQRRNLGFPAMVVAVVVLGLILVAVTRQDRVANAAPRANDDHWHMPFDMYTCVPDPSTPVTPPTTTTTTTAPEGSTTTTAPPTASGQGLAPVRAAHLGVTQEPSTTTTTAPSATTTTTLPGDTTTTTVVGEETTTTSTTVIAQPGDVPGVYQAHFQDPPGKQDIDGIHTHGDGVIHIHPFVSSSAGRNAQLKVFMDYENVTLTDDTLAFQDPNTGELLTYKEGTTKCQGGKDGIVQIGLWDKVEDAANGKPPNQVVTSNVGDVRLKNAHALTIAFLPKDSRIPIQSDVKQRFDNLTDVAPSTTTTTVPASESSGAESSGASSGAESTTVPATSSASSSSG